MPRADPHKQTSASASATIAILRQEPCRSCRPSRRTHRVGVTGRALQRHPGAARPRSGRAESPGPRSLARCATAKSAALNQPPADPVPSRTPAATAWLPFGQPVRHLRENGAVKGGFAGIPGLRRSRPRLAENLHELGPHALRIRIIALHRRRPEHVELLLRNESVLPVDASHACLAHRVDSGKAARPPRPKRALRRSYPQPLAARASLSPLASMRASLRHDERAEVRGSRTLHPPGVPPRPASANLTGAARLRLRHEEGAARSRPRLGPAIADLRRTQPPGQAAGRTGWGCEVARSTNNHVDAPLEITRRIVPALPPIGLADNYNGQSPNKAERSGGRVLPSRMIRT